MKHSLKAIFLVVTFICCHLFMRDFWGDTWSQSLLRLDGETYVLQTLARWLFIYSPFVFVAKLLFREEQWLDVLGLRTSKKDQYFLFALACCAPMILGYAYLSNGLNLSIPDLITGSLYPALFEEVIFRAILFGLLFRVCKWGFIPAALLSSAVFGVGHLYQSNDITSAMMLMGFMLVAGSWFAWLYCECGYRIWYPMWMHLIMNAAYGIFNMSGGAMGDVGGNIFKATAIILSLVFVGWLIKHGKQREVTLERLWRYRQNELVEGKELLSKT